MMPSPFPPTTQNLKNIVEQKRGIVKVALKDSPTIQMAIGKEEMSDAELRRTRTTRSSRSWQSSKGKRAGQEHIIKLTWASR
jgi:ribosomal protein L1